MRFAAASLHSTLLQILLGLGAYYLTIHLEAGPQPGRAEVLVAGRLAPVVGNVCMDMFMVDVTDIPEAAVGAEVVLVGRRPGPRGAVEITASDLARHAGTLHYEILTGISKRVPRVYVGE